LFLVDSSGSVPLVIAQTQSRTATKVQEEEVLPSDQAKRMKRREELRAMVRSHLESTGSEIRQLSVQERTEMRQQVRQQNAKPEQ